MGRTEDRATAPGEAGPETGGDREPDVGDTDSAGSETSQAVVAAPGNGPGDGDAGEPGDVPAGSTQTGKPSQVATPDSFDWRGWLVVVMVFVTFVVVPAFVLYLPEAHWVLTAIGFSRRQAYVVFPMVPAIVLGVTAVWAAVRAHSRGR